MKFKDLTSEQIHYIHAVYQNKSLSWDSRMSLLTSYLGKSERTVRKWLVTLGFKEKFVATEPEQYVKAQHKAHNSDKKRFIVTWAQNNTPVHKGFLKNIESYANYIDADIHVIAGRYKNPTSVWTEKQETDEYWPNEVLPYLDANRHDIHKYVSILSDIKIQPTAANPMIGMQALSGINTCIFGAPKVQMEMIPVLQGNKPKMMVTTGSVTKKNYTDSRSGKIGDFHHTFGFVVIEIKDDETFFIRQVTANDKTGNFTDLCHEVKNGEVTQIDSISAIILGDLHFGHHDQEVLKSTFDFINKITPKNVVLHDVFDGNSINHHDMSDPFIQYGKEVQGTNDLEKEIDNMLINLVPFEKFNNVVIVRSNHDDFLDRWLKNEDWKKQPTLKNSRLYMKFSDILLGQYADNPNSVGGVIPYLINKVFPKFITLNRGSSFRVKGWELGQHGDIGANGSRGSLLQFRKLNTKIVVGHYHSPGRKDGALAVGTSTKLRIGYNQGPSSWLQSHVIIHNDGRAQHISFIDGEFTTFKY